MIQIESEETFEQEVLQSKVPVLVDFYADWCGPCKMQAPVLEELSNEIGEDAKVCKLNVDQNRSLAEKYAIQSIPTLLIFSDGDITKTMIGLQSKDALKNALGV